MTIVRRTESSPEGCFLALDIGDDVLWLRFRLAFVTFLKRITLDHVLVDLSPFGVDNDGEVFIATDRPYGLIEARVQREAHECREHFGEF